MDPRNYNVKWDTPVGPQAQAERNDIYATYIQHGKRQHVKIIQVLVLIFMFFFLALSWRRGVSFFNKLHAARPDGSATIV